MSGFLNPASRACDGAANEISEAHSNDMNDSDYLQPQSSLQVEPSLERTELTQKSGRSTSPGPPPALGYMGNGAEQSTIDERRAELLKTLSKEQQLNLKSFLKGDSMTPSERVQPNETKDDLLKRAQTLVQAAESLKKQIEDTSNDPESIQRAHESLNSCSSEMERVFSLLNPQSRPVNYQSTTSYSLKPSHQCEGGEACLICLEKFTTQDMGSVLNLCGRSSQRCLSLVHKSCYLDPSTGMSDIFRQCLICHGPADKDAVRMKREALEGRGGRGRSGGERARSHSPPRFFMFFR